MPRSVFGQEHADLRESFGRYLDAEIVPNYEAWESEGRIPREVLRRAGELGFLGFSIPEEFGGAGIDDFRFNAVINEEAARRGLAAFALAVTMQNDVALPYFTELCDDEQKARWLPGIASGDRILAIAMSESMAMRSPPPMHNPLTAAMTGLRDSRIESNGTAPVPRSSPMLMSPSSC